MGNCMETVTHRPQVETMEQHQEKEEKGSGFVKENSGNNLERSGMRIKIVLTKEELGWLMFQLNNQKAGKRLEDVLGEIERSRGKIVGWKPSLESIMESPELLEMERQ